jgi:hypothetical protein
VVVLAHSFSRVFKVGLLAAVCLLSAAGISRAESTTIRAMLILASNDGAPQDARLDKIEYKLRRIFQFEYYRFYGEGEVFLNLPGQATIDLGRGFRLSISASDSGDYKVRTSVQWFRGDEMVLNTTVGMSRGVPVILGGISQDSGKLIVTLVAE